MESTVKSCCQQMYETQPHLKNDILFPVRLWQQLSASACVQLQRLPAKVLAQKLDEMPPQLLTRRTKKLIKGVKMPSPSTRNQPKIEASWKPASTNNCLTLQISTPNFTKMQCEVELCIEMANREFIPTPALKSKAKQIRRHQTTKSKPKRAKTTKRVSMAYAGAAQENEETAAVNRGKMSELTNEILPDRVDDAVETRCGLSRSNSSTVSSKSDLARYIESYELSDFAPGSAGSTPRVPSTSDNTVFTEPNEFNLINYITSRHAPDYDSPIVRDMLLHEFFDSSSNDDGVVGSTPCATDATDNQESVESFSSALDLSLVDKRGCPVSPTGLLNVSGNKGIKDSVVPVVSSALAKESISFDLVEQKSDSNSITLGKPLSNEEEKVSVFTGIDIELNLQSNLAEAAAPSNDVDANYSLAEYTPSEPEIELTWDDSYNFGLDESVDKAECSAKSKDSNEIVPQGYIDSIDKVETPITNDRAEKPKKLPTTAMRAECFCVRTFFRTAAVADVLREDGCVELLCAYYFMMSKLPLFTSYFVIFAERFACDKNRPQLLNMVSDWNLYSVQPQFLISIFQCLLQCGLNHTNACRLLIKRVYNRDPATMDVLVNIIFESDWFMFTTELEYFVLKKSYTFSCDKLEKMMRYIKKSKKGDYKTFFMKCILNVPIMKIWQMPDELRTFMLELCSDRC